MNEILAKLRDQLMLEAAAAANDAQSLNRPFGDREQAYKALGLGLGLSRAITLLDAAQGERS